MLAPSDVENKLGVEYDMRSLDSATSNINKDSAKPVYSISIMLEYKGNGYTQSDLLAVYNCPSISTRSPTSYMCLVNKNLTELSTSCALAPINQLWARTKAAAPESKAATAVSRTAQRQY